MAKIVPGELKHAQVTSQLSVISCRDSTELMHLCGRGKTDEVLVL